MAQQTISFTVDHADLPEIVRLFTDHHGWTSDLGVTRPVFLKKTIMRQFREAVQAQRKLEAAEAAKGEVPEGDVVTT